MDTYAHSEKKNPAKVELMGHRRQEKALREFKEILEDLVVMLRKATETETVYLYWINRARRQFVMETKATILSDVVFQDRVEFSGYFLDEYKNISQSITLKIGEDIAAESVGHYFGEEQPIEFITLLPFTNNEETVAITVLESMEQPFSTVQNGVIHSYINALGNVLNTYLEISDLYENQQEWVRYEETLSFLNKNGHSAGLLKNMLQTMQELVGEGSVSLITAAMGVWVNVLNSAEAERPLPLGIPVEERTLAWDALKKGEPEFAIHFNKNPKRISPREVFTEGATLAIPMSFNDRQKGLVMVYEQNPLIFKESTKHKLRNIVRLTGLKIQARHNKKGDEPFLTDEYGALIPDVWERAIDSEINRLKEGIATQNTWIGLVTLSKLSELRTQLRLEELNLMQKDLVKALNPSRFGIPGFVGFYTDYVYLVVLQSNDSKAVEHWQEQLTQAFRNVFELTNGKQINTSLHISTVPLGGEHEDSYEVVSEANRSLTKQTN